jgi:ornithine cyclodeaminase/alanine dehydrogenase-like protein (mu-crystallin family)
MSSVEIRYLPQREMKRTGFSPRDVVDTVEDVFRFKAGGKIIMPEKVSLEIGGKLVNEYINAMPAYVAPLGAAGIKWAGKNVNNPRTAGLPSVIATIIINDPVTTAPKALLDGTWVTAMRTAGASSVGARHLANKGPQVLAVIGAGVQGRSHLLCLREAIEIKEVRIFDVNPAACETYVSDMADRTGLSIHISSSAEEAIRGSDVVSSCTSTLQPYLQGEWLEGVSLLTAIAAHEVTESVVRWADKIVVDDLTVNTHRGNLNWFFRDGTLKREDIYAEIHEIVGGEKPGRESPEERIWVNTVGMGSEDLAVAYRIYERAVAMDLGEKLEFDLGEL